LQLRSIMTAEREWLCLSSSAQQKLQGRFVL
jgi:hypothetical protein